MRLTRQQYYDLGNDTERWWREHVRGVMAHLRHTPKCRGHDFKGQDGPLTVYVDVKFLREEYRQKGWIEVKTWGKLTGIIETAREHFDNPHVETYITVLAEGRWHLLDARSLIEEWTACRLPLHTGTATDDEGNTTETKYWLIDGWTDPKFCVAHGPLKPQLWKPQTQIGKQVDINAWMEGEWI
jgi:hypothetical protein